MAGLYLIALIVGGALILMSVFGAFHAGDAEVATDAALEAHADVAVADAGGHDGQEHGHESWIPFLSLRFWTYFFAAGGACGLLFTYLSALREPVVGLISGGTGLFVGLVVASAMRWVAGTDTDSSMKERDLLGQTAKVIVSSREGLPGRVRCEVKGEIIDMLALPEGEYALEMGSDVVIVAMENGTVKVVPRDTIFG